jgi:Cdc6-like AAA superfamily ATPase
MKQFVFDRLVDPDNICNLQREQQALREGVGRGHRMVVYGPRNYGKTSVVRNVTIEEFRRARGRNFVLFADLLGVRSMQSLTRRLATSLQRSFAASFPVRSLLENASRFLGALRPEIALDPQTGSPSLSLQAHDSEPDRSLQTLWEHIAGITAAVDSLIVLDEFQDVAFIEEVPEITKFIGATRRSPRSHGVDDGDPVRGAARFVAT